MYLREIINMDCYFWFRKRLVLCLLEIDLIYGLIVVYIYIRFFGLKKKKRLR